jgi:sulfate transport system substrate-binding protein
VWDRSRGRLPFEVVYPRATILSEHTVVVLDRNVAPARRPLVDAFAAFLWSDEAQRIFVRYGFRSVDERWNSGNPAFGAIAEPFGVDAFGGWTRARAEIVDRAWRDDVMKAVRR